MLSGTKKMGLGYKKVSHFTAGSSGLRLIQYKVSEFPSTMINVGRQEKGEMPSCLKALWFFLGCQPEVGCSFLVSLNILKYLT